MLLQLGVPTVVVSSVEAAREFLKTHDMIVAVDLPYTKRVQSFQFIREEEVTLLIDSIAQSSSSGSPIDLTERLMSLTANIICRIAFGKSFSTDFFPYVGRIVDRLTGHHGRLERSFLEMDGFYERVIEDHLNPGRGFILGWSGHWCNHPTWAMTELARNPRIMKKAQVEVRNSIGNKGKVTEGDVDQLHYLKMVVKETLRLHPPAPLLVPRETMSHFEINGYHIYPKTQVHVNVWAIGRDPNLWKNPEEFLPERFMDNSVDFRGQHFELLPFGAGRRICPGMYMAIATVELALANLLYRFNWNLPNGMREADINMEEAAGLTVRKKFALNLVPILHHC
ncbi:Cytochrome P450 71B34 [Vitis vinifera]|uniref:Cytochrome P450 71B34 n=1 Tax=Vitis vinifera TaxID=29760 RepID=A0A438J5S4_VITVI|nr:Cytochrome P450 71B34 [Vitis vinifera]